LLYGAGLRLGECLRLRVKDLDFGCKQIVVREAKGNKDRVTMLPATLAEPLKCHLASVKGLHIRDLREGFGQVNLPFALGRKYPGADTRMGLAICLSGSHPQPRPDLEEHPPTSRRSLALAESR